jgi:hypothetical protein
MTEWNNAAPPADVWGKPPVANQPPANVWGPPQTPAPQTSPQAQPATGQELTPDEKATFETQFRNDPDKLFKAWRLEADGLEIFKAREMKMRKLVFKVYVPKPQEGTNNVQLTDGLTLKAVYKFNYKLDNDNDKVEAALKLVQTIGGPEGKVIAERLVAWKPTLVLREYDLLIEDAAKEKQKEQMLLAINQVITKTPATPALDVVEPKKPK